MRFGRIRGLDEPVSRAVIGCEHHDGREVWDRFVELGGNAFDTSHVWCDGAGERALGRWLADRGLAGRSLVVVKGGHPPHCDPASIGRQLHASLDRLRLSAADVYLLHRDDPAIPVGELVDAMHEQAAAGRIRALGVSNWTTTRIREAQAYAARLGRRPLDVLSNHLSLATLVRPPHPGLVSAAPSAFRAFLARARIPNLAWSSQALGYFHGASPRAVRAFDSAPNRERRRRSARLAALRGLGPGHVALAWVTGQPFESFAVIGARTAEHVEDSLRGLALELTEPELAWLDLQRDTPT